MKKENKQTVKTHKQKEKACHSPTDSSLHLHPYFANPSISFEFVVHYNFLEIQHFITENDKIAEGNNI